MQNRILSDAEFDQLKKDFYSSREQFMESLGAEATAEMHKAINESDDENRGIDSTTPNEDDKIARKRKFKPAFDKYIHNISDINKTIILQMRDEHAINNSNRTIATLWMQNATSYENARALGSLLTENGRRCKPKGIPTYPKYSLVVGYTAAGLWLLATSSLFNKVSVKYTLAATCLIIASAAISGWFELSYLERQAYSKLTRVDITQYSNYKSQIESDIFELKKNLHISQDDNYIENLFATDSSTQTPELISTQLKLGALSKCHNLFGDPYNKNHLYWVTSPSLHLDPEGVLRAYNAEKAALGLSSGPSSIPFVSVAAAILLAYIGYSMRKPDGLMNFKLPLLAVAAVMLPAMVMEKDYRNQCKMDKLSLENAINNYRPTDIPEAQVIG